MSGLECLGESSSSSQKQPAVEVTSAHTETHKPSDAMEKKKVTDKPRRSPPASTLPSSVQISCQETQKAGPPSGDVLKPEERAPKEPTDITLRVEEQAESSASPDEELKMKDSGNAQPAGSARKGGTTHAPVELLAAHELNEEEKEAEEEDAEDEDLKAPVELIIEFLGAVMDRNFQLAHKLCQMILIYEPDNPEASEFLPLIRKKLQEEQEAEQEDEEEEDEDESDDYDDDEEDSGSDEESSKSSSCSSSSCSSSSPSDDDDEEKETQVNRHKPCPPSHISP